MPCEASPHITDLGLRPPARTRGLFLVFLTRFELKEATRSSFVKEDFKECRPAINLWPMDSFLADRHQITANDDSPQPVVSPNVQGSNSETLAVFRGAEQGKQRQPTHGSGLPSKTRARVATLFLAKQSMFGTSFQKSVSQNDLPDLDSLVQIKNRDNLRVLNCSEPNMNRTGLVLPGRSGTSTTCRINAG
ncbi:hypothetical protein HYC85_029255 [Camellia sinensis]|uniref:Uncharacterized protein n=1 Tax=Camellia sinensis TaxID=4442 RepID=A0A7J7G1E1_CAMSI|nr:hypothetical protein HYC85_029255 [Camellia sinensis]